MDNQSWNTNDKYIVDGLINILVLNVKINKLTDRDQVNAPSKLKDHDPLLKYDKTMLYHQSIDYSYNVFVYSFIKDV